MSYLIKSIELVKFVGMKLNSIERFSLSFTKEFTVILGRNGSGKSRLMWALTPLSLTKKDVFAGGSKSFKFLYDGVNYHVFSEYDGRHVKNTLTNTDSNVIIHEGVNPSVHNRVILDKFKYSQELHDLLMGINNLTSMKGPERKKWFSKLSESDLTYALRFFSKTKEIDRDITGTLKSVRYSIGELRPRVLASEEERETISARISSLNDDLKVVENELSSLSHVRQVEEAEVFNTLSAMELLNKQISKLNIQISGEDKALDAGMLRESISKADSEYEVLLEQLRKVEGVINDTVAIAGLDVDELRAECCSLEYKMREGEGHVAVFRAFQAIWPKLIGSNLTPSKAIWPESINDNLTPSQANYPKLINNDLSSSTDDSTPYNPWGDIFNNCLDNLPISHSPELLKCPSTYNTTSNPSSSSSSIIHKEDDLDTDVFIGYGVSIPLEDIQEEEDKKEVNCSYISYEIITKMMDFKMGEGVIESGEYVLAKHHFEAYKSALINAVNGVTLDYPVSQLRDEYYRQLDALNKAKTEQAILRSHDEKLTDWLKEVMHVHDVTCDKCNHVFKPGITAEDLARRKAQGEQLADKIVAKENEITHLQEMFNEVSLTLNKYDEFVNVVRTYSQYPLCSLLFDELQSRGVFIKGKGEVCGGLIRQYGIELDIAIEMTQARDKLKLLINDIKLAEAKISNDNGQIEGIRQNLNESIDLILSKKAGYEHQLKVAADVQERITAADALFSQLQLATESHGAALEGRLHGLRAETLKDHREVLWKLLTTAKLRFDSLNKDKETLISLESLLESNLERSARLKEIVKRSSPDSGFLAKYLYQSIAKVTDFMSNYLSYIWGYKLVVLPCDVQDGDLDYLFPFWAKSPKNREADISHGSKGQREVFDFVFVLAIYRALGLQQWPIFMDELSSSFDEKHKERLMTFVKTLVSDKHNSQVAMISHDGSSHFKLTNAAFVAIDGEGVTLPKLVNQDVIIE